MLIRQQRLSINDFSAIQAENLHEALSTLDQRSREILNARWLQEDKQTLHELAAQYNISAERIRQLEKNALGKLKRLMS